MKAIVSLFVLLNVFAEYSSADKISHDNLSDILKSGISNKVYPGIAAISGSVSGKYIYSGAFGTYEYTENNPESLAVDLDKSIFDIASLSKVVATTTAVALLYQKGLISVHDLVSKHLTTTYAQNGKENVTILNCLLHNAGYQPDPNPPYYSGQFACPSPLGGDGFTCIDQVYASLLKESLVTSPGTAFVYSDLSFITLQFIVGKIAYSHNLVRKDSLRSECRAHETTTAEDAFMFNCYFEAFVRTAVLQESHQWMPSTGYLPQPDLYPLILPTVNQTQGHVSDSNCYAMGGVCGHAGIFSTAPDLAKLLTRLLRLSVADSDDLLQDKTHPEDSGASEWLNSTTVRFFTTEFNQTQSSRALGWTTNDQTVNDFGFSNSCGNMSAATFMHIGYTGTCLCVDPVSRLWSVILTNRVYGVPMGDSTAVKAIYKDYHNALLSAVREKEI